MATTLKNLEKPGIFTTCLPDLENTWNFEIRLKNLENTWNCEIRLSRFFQVRFSLDNFMQYQYLKKILAPSALGIYNLNIKPKTMSCLDGAIKFGNQILSSCVTVSIKLVHMDHSRYVLSNSLSNHHNLQD